MIFVDLKTQIENLWNADKGDLSQTLNEAIKLIRKAMDTDEDLPLETIVDILITANTSIGFGSEFDQANFMVKILSILLKSTEVSEIPKFYRFICTIFGIVLTLLSVDETRDEKMVPGILKPLGINSKATPIQSISLMYNIGDKLISDISMSYWGFEFISFMITMKLIIEQIDNDSDIDHNKVMMKMKDVMNKKIVENSEAELLDWKKRWLAGSDYYRFTSMMIFDKHPSDQDVWIKTLSELV